MKTRPADMNMSHLQPRSDLSASVRSQVTGTGECRRAPLFDDEPALGDVCKVHGDEWPCRPALAMEIAQLCNVVAAARELTGNFLPDHLPQHFKDGEIDPDDVLNLVAAVARFNETAPGANVSHSSGRHHWSHLPDGRPYKCSECLQ